MQGKNIWILNHYSHLGSGRHYKFAANLIERGHIVKMFAAGTVHNSDKNRINDSAKYIKEIESKVSCIYIRARNYTGNGKQRILNMMDYSTGLMSVSKRFDSTKPDIIYASSVHPLTWLAGYRLAKRYKAKFIAETRDLWPETLVAMGQIKRSSIPAKLLYKLEKFIYTKADKLIFTMPGGKDYIKNIGLSTDKVRYINNGIDLDEFNQNKEKYIYDDKDLENKNTFKVLYTGSMGQANALSYLLESAKIIQSKGIKNIKFILFGDGYEREKLKKFARDNKLENILFKGKVEKKYIPYILTRSNLNILSLEHLPNLFKYGLSPNKMFDYFASGKPTLSNVECGYDMLDQYKCGLTVEGGSPETLAQGIIKFYEMPKEEYSDYCQNALRAAKDFDFKVLAEKLEKVILED